MLVNQTDGGRSSVVKEMAGRSVKVVQTFRWIGVPKPGEEDVDETGVGDQNTEALGRNRQKRRPWV